MNTIRKSSRRPSSYSRTSVKPCGACMYCDHGLPCHNPELREMEGFGILNSLDIPGMSGLRLADTLASDLGNTDEHALMLALK